MYILVWRWLARESRHEKILQLTITATKTKYWDHKRDLMMSEWMEFIFFRARPWKQKLAAKTRKEWIKYVNKRHIFMAINLTIGVFIFLVIKTRLKILNSKLLTFITIIKKIQFFLKEFKWRKKLFRVTPWPALINLIENYHSNCASYYEKIMNIVRVYFLVAFFNSGNLKDSAQNQMQQYDTI
jgi:hypothetical protein